MRQPRRLGGRWLFRVLLPGFLAMGLTLAGYAQPPVPNVSPAPAVSASATPSQQSPTTVQTPEAVQATPLPSGQRPLALPSPVSDAKALADWRADGTVGKSTFVDRIRKVTWTLAFICFLIWGAGKIVGRATLQKWGLPVEAESMIEVLEKKRLSPGRSILLLRVGPKVLAVAATESGYSTLTELDAEALKQFQDEKSTPAPSVDTANPAQSPGDIAKHYLSIIPGLGAKK